MPKAHLVTDFKNFKQGVIIAVAKIENSSKKGSSLHFIDPPHTIV